MTPDMPNDATTEDLSEEPKTIVGPDGEPMEVSRSLMLGVERFKRPEKHYRLIWIKRDEAWLCEEDTTKFRRVWGDDGAVKAGHKLADSLGVTFSGVVR